MYILIYDLYDNFIRKRTSLDIWLFLHQKSGFGFRSMTEKISEIRMREPKKYTAGDKISDKNTHRCALFLETGSGFALVKSWIRIRNKVKIQDFSRLKMLPWSLKIEAWTLKLEAWRVCRPVVASLDEEQDPDPHGNEKLDPDQDSHGSEKSWIRIWISIEVKKAGSGFAWKWKKLDPDPDSHWSEKKLDPDPSESWIRIRIEVKKAGSGSALKWRGSEILDRRAGDNKHLWLWGRSPRSPRPRSCSPCRGTSRCPPPAPPWWSGSRPPEPRQYASSILDCFRLEHLVKMKTKSFFICF